MRNAQVPKRAPILARDGTPLAEGPATSRSSPLGAAAQSVAGVVSSPSRQQNRELSRLGFPPGTPTGTSGLELAFNRRLAGRPGGQLVAAAAGGGGPVLATSKPVPGTPVHTTIDPALQQAAVAALGGQYGGVAVLDARNGSVLALAGIAFSGPQPPGSTFKLITTTAALEAGVVKLTDQFPIQTSTVVGGREVANAHNEACGGTLRRGLRRVVQQRLRAARAEARLGAARGSGGALRLQLAAQPVQRAGNSNRGPARRAPSRPRSPTPSTSG